MNKILRPDNRIFYMKVGCHASEPLDQILARKLKEIEREGMAFWGYGGGTCHPVNVVQPFAKSFIERGGTMYLCMEPMESRHFAQSVRAQEFSVDGVQWQPIPNGINVTGSRYAVVIKDIRPEEIELPLSQTRVAMGNSVGLPGSRYISGRVDKACLELVDHSLEAESEGKLARIGFVAEIVEPYAVFVRNLPT